MTPARTPGWSGLRGLRVGVWGVGVEGRSTLRRLAAEGVEVAAVVDREGGRLDDDRPVLGFGAGGFEALVACDVVVRSPGISPYGAESLSVASAGVSVLGGLGLWLESAPRSRVACVTGTKGKSTTTAVAGALARGLGAGVFVGGNLGTPPWDPSQTPADWYIVEVSSYQAYSVTAGPRVVAVTSLAQDHLTWHHGYDNYVRDKLSLCTRPGVETVVVPAADAELTRHRSLLGPSVDLVGDAHPAWVDVLPLLGHHNRRNALVAARVLQRLGVPGADDPALLEKAATSYEPLPSRLTPVGTVGGVDFVDDSLSTNALAALAAVSAFPGRRLALLAGGDDRGIDYGPLADGLAARGGALRVFTVPDSGPRIAAELRSRAAEVDVVECPDLVTAVGLAHAWAVPDGVVLLSPAAPSFGVFRDYRERAEVFTRAVRELT
ncbi:UDP-N-acetylmuramoyl-L-alanine--D-glutamate ligase [Spongisporangium articulatum]|uniref:UDP-N-acetylmuramoylalanine--D-glutamate ligase n=1 Tax=Spongisporangium articulatum TaxID=3362603 RepID=A0ABW8AU16_9ACTN